MLDKVGMKPKRQEPATLSGFDIRISPYVNLVRGAGHTVFGMLMEVTHAELEHTYSQLKARYLPEAVIVSDCPRSAASCQPAERRRETRCDQAMPGVEPQCRQGTLIRLILGAVSPPRCRRQ